MKENKNIYEKSYFIDMESGVKDYKKTRKKRTKEKERQSKSNDEYINYHYYSVSDFNIFSIFL